MAISSVGSNARPGVCTSTTRPTTPFEGQLIYETDTNRVLIWDNAAWVMIADTDAPPALQLIETKSITSATSLAFTSKFTSDFRNYKIVGSLQGSTNIALEARLRNGSTDDLTTAYRWNQLEMSSTTPSVTIQTGQDEWYISNMANSGTNSCAFEMTLWTPQVSGLTSFTATTTFEWTSNSFYFRHTGGQFDGTTQFDGINFFGGANWTGTFSLYGLRD